MIAVRPKVSVVVPVVAETERLERCLAAVRAQSWPWTHLEVIVIDGDVDCGSGDLATRLLMEWPIACGRVIRNPGGNRANNLNRGLVEATGEVVCRVDARSAIPPDYIAVCVELLQDPHRSVVGGSQTASAPGHGVIARGIERALNNRLGMGMARYRRGSTDGPADTVYLGAFRAEDLRREGGWDEELLVNEDFELNQRMSRHGTVWFDSRLDVSYLPRGSLGEIARQYWSFGGWKVEYLVRSGDRPRLRQIAGLAVAPIVIAGTLALLLLPRGPRRVAVAGALVAGFVIEEVGTTVSESAGPRTRLVSVATSLTVAVSWSVGGICQCVRRWIRRSA